MTTTLVTATPHTPGPTKTHFIAYTVPILFVAIAANMDWPVPAIAGIALLILVVLRNRLQQAPPRSSAQRWHERCLIATLFLVTMIPILYYVGYLAALPAIPLFAVALVSGLWHVRQHGFDSPSIAISYTILAYGVSFLDLEGRRVQISNERLVLFCAFYALPLAFLRSPLGRGWIRWLIAAVPMVLIAAAPGFDFRAFDKNELSEAAKRGDATSLRILLSVFRDDPNYRLHTWDPTPLQLAVSKGNVEAARVLISHGADPNIENQHNHPVIDAASLGNIELLEILAAQRSVDFDKWIALHQAASKGYAGTVKWLCEHQKLVGGQGALGAALQRKDADTMKVLLDRMSATDLLYELVYAGRANDLELARFLLKRGVNPNQLDPVGNAPFVSAVRGLCFKGNVEMIDVFLKEFHADPLFRDQYGKTALMYAAGCKGDP